LTGTALSFIDNRFCFQGLDRFSLSAEDMRLPQNSTLVLVGWAALPTLEPAYDLEARVDGRVMGTIFRDFREDIGRHFVLPSMCNCGFHITIDVASLALGDHELTITFGAGVHAIAPIAFTVTEPTRVRHTIVHSERYTASVETFHGDFAPESVSYRVERSSAGVVRGTLADALGRGAPEALYGIVDDFDVYPARIDPQDSRFLVCFISRTLALGPHELRLAVQPRGESMLHVLAPIRFDVTPLSIDLDLHGPERSTAIASCSWATDPTTTAIVDAPARSFARGSIAYVRGWAIDTATSDSVKDVHLCFDNGEQFRMETRQLRSDVARERGVPGAHLCGFVGSVAVDALVPGRNVGRIYVVLKDEITLLSTGATVEIDYVTAADGSRAL
jgi:hypothetical protein